MGVWVKDDDAGGTSDMGMSMGKGKEKEGQEKTGSSGGCRRLGRGECDCEPGTCMHQGKQ